MEDTKNIIMNIISFFIFAYGMVVVFEALLVFKKSITAADFMWYVCRVFGVPFSLKTALVIRALLLITGGWALISRYQDIINAICSR